MSANSQTTSSQLPAASVALTDVQWSLVNQALTTLSPQQMLWLSGYLAGMAQSAQVPVGLVQPQDIKQSLTILYGSQTGNAKAIASELKSKFAEQNVPVSLFNMADYKHKQLKSETHLVVVVSTHGEGDAPDDAVELHQFLASKKVGKLDQLSYAVLGLGDSSY